jgi:co-chaperonin GroES (HSP10)
MIKITQDNKLKNIVIVGDRVLIKPKKLSEKTTSGLYLPPGVQERERIQSGYVIKAGPGYPIPLPGDDEEPWKADSEKVKYIPLQVKEGDLAIFLQNGSFEVMYEQEKYFIVPQSSILMLEREDDLL